MRSGIAYTATRSVLGIGIDFGTSNASVALFDGEALSLVRLEADGGRVMPTALYLDRERRPRVGQPAVDAYLEQNAGRLVELDREEVGHIEVTVAGTEDTRGSDDGGAITDAFGVYAMTDRGQPGRLFRSLKRWLGSSQVERVRVFDAGYRIVALCTPILAHLANAGRSAAGGAAAVHVGRPVVFEGDSDIAVKRLAEACGYADLDGATLYPEPVAAALSFLRTERPPDGGTLLCFDFGGGTLDLCVLRLGSVGDAGESFEVLSTHGIAIGGDAIDRDIYRAAVFPEIGEGCEIASRSDGPRTHRFPFESFGERLLNWQLAYELNRMELRETIALGVRLGGENAVRLRRLRELISRNQSYRVFRAIERAKIELSDRKRARIEVPELDLSIPFTRASLEHLLEPTLEAIERGVAVSLHRAGVAPDAVGAVVCTGGSSRIPVVRERLERSFPGRTIEHGTFTSIAAGLAVASYRGYRSPLDSGT